MHSLPVVEARGGLKVAAHNYLEDCEPGADPPDIRQEEVDRIRTFIDQYIPELSRARAHSQRCYYTETQDGELSIGPVPESPNIILVAPAGHGFKFAPVLGEVLADLAMDQPPQFPLSGFRVDRP